jgi:hypothetical protein
MTWFFALYGFFSYFIGPEAKMLLLNYMIDFF